MPAASKKDSRKTSRARLPPSASPSLSQPNIEKAGKVQSEAGKETHYRQGRHAE